MAVQLPQQPASGIILPPQPQNPPTLADVFLALRAVDTAYSQSPDQSSVDLSRLQASWHILQVGSRPSFVAEI